MKAYNAIKFSIDSSGVATITMARPQAHNAMNSEMLEEFRDAVAECHGRSDIRVVVLAGEGKSFSAGGDIKGQQLQKDHDESHRLEEAGKFASLLKELDELNKPLIGKIHGGAYGGGVGLVTVCDVAIAVASSEFAVTEVRLGLTPSVIAPYMLRRMGQAAARRLILTARSLKAGEAVAVGLVDRVVDAGELDAAVAEEIGLLLRCAPSALAASKRLISYMVEHGIEENLAYGVDCVADIWTSGEAAEGMLAFIEKRQPSWSQAPARRNP